VRPPESLEHGTGALPLSCLLSLNSPISSTRGFIFSPGWDREAYLACPSRLNLRPSCSSPPPQVIQTICHSREPQRSKPWLEASQRRGARIPCEVPGVHIYQKGSGGRQKPFSWLSEGVGGIFTINTEAGEIAYVLHTSTSSVRPHALVVAGAGGHSIGIGPSPRNGCRNAWETVALYSGVVTEGTRGQGQGVGGMSTRAASWLAC
jgi:hypothetical protein